MISNKENLIFILKYLTIKEGFFTSNGKLLYNNNNIDFCIYGNVDWKNEEKI